MMKIGSNVIFCGELWNNQMKGIQPVWGVKKSCNEDEIPQQPTEAREKSFAELLEEEMNIISIK